jgi:hypothetical protein
MLDLAAKSFGPEAHNSPIIGRSDAIYLGPNAGPRPLREIARTHVTRPARRTAALSAPKARCRMLRSASTAVYARVVRCVSPQVESSITRG